MHTLNLLKTVIEAPTSLDFYTVKTEPTSVLYWQRNRTEVFKAWTERFWCSTKQVVAPRFWHIVFKEKLNFPRWRIEKHFEEQFITERVNDPSAGSPTETLLRLLLPLSDKVHETFRRNVQKLSTASVRIIYRITQSVGATGGVYKGQGRNQHELMTRAY